MDVEAARTPGQQAGAPGVHPRPSLLQVAAHLATEQRKALLIGPGVPGPLTAGLAEAWEKLAGAAIGLVRDLAAPAVADGQVSARKSRRDAAHALKAYLSYLGPAAGIAGPALAADPALGAGPALEAAADPGLTADPELTPDPARMTDLLLNLVIAERALLPLILAIDQPVEFIQVSANTRTLIAPGEDTVEQAVGGRSSTTSLAFYNSSWRAYYYMWGLLDGSGWLVHILLDPRRILAVAEDEPGLRR